MTTQLICSNCSRTLPADAPDELCPYCLLAVPDEPTTALDRSAFQPPQIDQLQQHFDPERLQILQLIGSGGMGAVYRASQPGLGREVALKILPPELATSPGFDERFSREARVLARLDHLNVVDVYDYGRAGPYSFLVLEHVDGVNLRELLRGGVMHPNDAMEIIPQLCDALQYAHDQGVIHRDIKPENILVDTRGRVKITDFGLAKLVDPGQLGASLTRTHQVLGTPSYMAPEQVEHPDRVDHRADIYALGVVFYELLTGELPLGRFSPPSLKNRGSRRLDKVVMKTLEKEPGKRYEKASDVKSDVERASGDQRRRAAQRAADFFSGTAGVGTVTPETLRGVPMLIAALHAITLVAFYGTLLLTLASLGSIALIGYLLAALAIALVSRGLAELHQPPGVMQPLARPPHWIAEQILTPLGLLHEGRLQSLSMDMTPARSALSKIDRRNIGLILCPACLLIAAAMVIMALEEEDALWWAIAFSVVAVIISRVHLHSYPQDRAIRGRRWLLLPPIYVMLFIITAPLLLTPTVAMTGFLTINSEGQQWLQTNSREVGPVAAIAAAVTLVITIQFVWTALLLAVLWLARRPVRWIARPVLDDYQGRGVWLATLSCICVALLSGTASWFLVAS